MADRLWLVGYIELHPLQSSDEAQGQGQKVKKHKLRPAVSWYWIKTGWGMIYDQTQCTCPMIHITSARALSY